MKVVVKVKGEIKNITIPNSLRTIAQKRDFIYSKLEIDKEFYTVTQDFDLTYFVLLDEKKIYENIKKGKKISVDVLLDAIEMDSKEVAYAIMNFDKSILSRRNYYKGTPLFCACSSGNIEILKFILKLDLDVEKVEFHGGLLTYAAMHNQLEMAKYLLSEKITKINEVSDVGYTPLHMSISRNSDKHNCIEMVKFLIDSGIDINRSCYAHGDTALSFAVLRENYDVVKLLLDKGAIDHNNRAMLTSCIDRNGKMIDILKSYGIREIFIEPNFCDSDSDY